MKTKRIVATLIMVSVLLSITVPVYATTNEYGSEKSLTFDSIDFAMPYTETIEYKASNGEDVTIGVCYTPSIQTRGSETKDASVGTWEVWMTYGVFYMEYEFDLSHPGGWNISNARNLIANGSFMKIIDRSLSIGRATSTATFPATVSGIANCSLFDNAWVHICDITYILSVSVSHSGKVTISW